MLIGKSAIRNVDIGWASRTERIPLMPSAVTSIAAAPSEAAIAHFEAEFTFETDCWDTHEALASGDPTVAVEEVPLLLDDGRLADAVRRDAARELPDLKLVVFGQPG